MPAKIYVVENERRSIQSSQRTKHNRRTPDPGHSAVTVNRRHCSAEDRRNPTSPDRRDHARKTISKKNIDFLFEFLQWRGEFLTEHIRDKEKKKLAIIVSSFAVFSLVTTVALGMLSSKNINSETLISPAFNILLGVFLIGIASINTAIIKHIVSLKSDALLFLRQLNCLRQALHVIMLAKLDGFLPEDLFQEILGPQPSPQKRPLTKNHRPLLKRLARKLHIIFLSTHAKKRYARMKQRHRVEKSRCDALKKNLFENGDFYWRLYGRHEKLPLDNEALRSSYSDSSIFFRSADMFSVIIIALFTVLLTLAPTLYLFLEIDTENKMSIFIGQTGAVVSIAFIALVIIIVKSALKKIRHELNDDHSGNIHFRNAVQDYS